MSRERSLPHPIERKMPLPRDLPGSPGRLDHVGSPSHFNAKLVDRRLQTNNPIPMPEQRAGVDAVPCPAICSACAIKRCRSTAAQDASASRNSASKRASAAAAACSAAVEAPAQPSRGIEISALSRGPSARRQRRPTGHRCRLADTGTDRRPRDARAPRRCVHYCPPRTRQR